jgi:hypothetical protein
MVSTSRRLLVAAVMAASLASGAAEAQTQGKYYFRQRLMKFSSLGSVTPPKTFCSGFTPKKWIGPGATCGQIPWDGSASSRAANCEAEAKKTGSTQGLCLSYTSSTLLYCRGGVLSDQSSTDFEGATCSQ